MYTSIHAPSVHIIIIYTDTSDVRICQINSLLSALYINDHTIYAYYIDYTNYYNKGYH